MSTAPNYTPTTSFATDETNQVAGRSTVKTVSVDIELANISSSINALNTNIKLLQRDDGKPKDFLIEPYALSEQTRALLAASGTVRGLWVGATSYAQGDVVQYSGFAYLCITAHTSSGAFDTALWMAVSGDGSASASAISAAASAVLADADRVSAESAAATAVANASTSTTQAGIATAQATIATNKASAASTSETNAAASAAAAQAAVVGNIGSAIHSATEDTTPNDASEIGIWNDITGLLGKITIANLIAKLAALTSTWSISTTGNAATAGIPQNSKSAAYTVVLADANKHIYHPSTDNNARTFTIDSNANVAFEIGTTLTFVNEINTVTIAITTDTLTLFSAGTTGSRTLAAYGIATALKVSATKWVISGVGLT